MPGSYNTFQSALSSTPFPNTKADTTIPTPSGDLTQTPTPTPSPTEMPGPSGDAERLRKIQADRSLIQQQLQLVSQMRGTQVGPFRWTQAFTLALNGREKEPASATYRRYGMMSELLNADAALAQEERLLTQPSPTQQADMSDAADRERRRGFVDHINELHRQAGLPEIPLENAYQFIEKGYSLDQAVVKGAADDEVKKMISQANLGQEVGPEGLKSTGLTGRAADVAMAGAVHGEKVRREQKAKDETLPVLGLFKTPGELLRAMNTDYQDGLRIQGNYHMEKTETLDPFGKPTERMAWTPEEKKSARAYAAARWDGYEKYFPNYIEKGASDVPTVNPEQQGVDVNAIRKSLVKKPAETK